MLYTAPAITIYSCFIAALLGACMGSFLNCAAWRIVHGESVLRGRSHCDVCGHVLAPRDLVPVFSYVFSHGRCRYCGAKLSPRHAVGEAVAALVFVSLLLRYDISLRTLEAWAVACLLLACAFADLEGYIIPDRFIAVGVVLFIVTLFFVPDPGKRALDGLIGGVAVGGGVLLLALLMEKLLRRDAMGGGDIKLAYFAGSTLKKAAMAPLPDNMVADGRILSMDAMADFLRQAARDNGIPLTNAAVVLPSTEVFTRELTMPAMTEQQLRYNLPYEFRDFLTDEKSKYYFDYSMRDILRDQDGYPTEMTLLACAMLKETAERYRAMMRRAGFKLQVLTPSECAYAGVLAAYYRRTGLPQRDMCIVNLGYTAAYLYIYRGAFFESRREIDLGLNRLEQLVAEHCGVDIHVAHSYVLQNYNDVLSSDYAQSFYARIAVEVMKAVNFFNYNNRQQELTDLCLCSGGCNIGPLRQALAETTHLHLHTAQELLGDDVTLDEPWMYLRAIGGVDEGLRGGLQ